MTELDEFTFYDVLPETKGISFIFFSGPHCASCHHLRDLLSMNIDMFESAFNDFQVFEVRAEKAGALVNEFTIFHLPTMFLYLNGHFHCEIQAEAHPAKLIEAIKIALEKSAEEEP